MNASGYSEIKEGENVVEYVDTITDMRKIKQKAKERLLLEYEYNYLKTQIEDNKETDDPYVKRLRWLNTQILTNQKHKAASTYYWVTVSPKPQTSLESLQVKVEKYSRSKMIMAIMYAYELRPHDNTPHCHMIVKPLGVSDSDFRKRTKNPFKDICSAMCVDIRTMRPSYLADKIEYLKGNKWDLSKADACDQDKIFREENGLDPYYVVGDIFGDMSDNED